MLIKLDSKQLVTPLVFAEDEPQIVVIKPYFGASTVYKVFKGKAEVLETFEDSSPHLEANSVDMYKGFKGARLSIDGQSYQVNISPEGDVTVISAEDMRVLSAMADLRVNCTTLEDNVVGNLRGRSSFFDVRDIYAAIELMTTMTEQEGFNLIYDLIREEGFSWNERECLLLLFRSKTFTDNIGATQWVFKDKPTKDLEGLINLGADPIDGDERLLDSRGIIYCEKDGYVISSTSSGASSCWKYGGHAFYKLADKDFSITSNEVPVPRTLNCVTLNSVNLKRGLQLSDNPTITVIGDCSIQVRDFDSCIRAKGVVKFTGEGTLRLSCKEYSSAIGNGAVSQSYGRYVPAREWKTALALEVIVDGIELIVNSDVANFSLGDYGVNNDVSISTINGGSVVGVPETLGRVRLVSVGTTSDGSTKIEGPAVYALDKEDLSSQKGITNSSAF